MYNLEDFAPTVDMGQYFSVVTAQGTEKFYECVYIEPLPKSQDLQHDFGSISSGSTDSSNKITILEVEGSAKTETDLSELFQMRMEVIDDIALTIKEPAAQSRFKTRNDEIRIDAFTPPEQSEIYVFEDDTIYIDAYNPTQYTLTVTRVQFWGWRIIGRQLGTRPEKYTRIVATGFSR
jgi:hypothetical protein